MNVGLDRADARQPSVDPYLHLAIRCVAGRRPEDVALGEIAGRAIVPEFLALLPDGEQVDGEARQVARETDRA